MRTLLRRLLPHRWLPIINCFRDRKTDIFCQKSYSQEGEDMLLQRIFESQSGFFVDVGAHHPHRFSNTYFFYRRGWRGINIEPNPEAMSMFRAARPRDTNLQAGIAVRPGKLTYYQFDEPALNTFDYEVVKSKLANSRYKLRASIEVDVERLDEVLARHLPDNTEIDFLTIDVEGLDFQVLQSNNWDMYRPKCVLVEIVNASIEGVIRSEIYRFMRDRKYVFFAKTHNTIFFLRE